MENEGRNYMLNAAAAVRVYAQDRTVKNLTALFIKAVKKGWHAPRLKEKPAKTTRRETPQCEPDPPANAEVALAHFEAWKAEQHG